MRLSPHKLMSALMVAMTIMALSGCENGSDSDESEREQQKREMEQRRAEEQAMKESVEHQRRAIEQFGAPVETSSPGPSDPVDCSGLPPVSLEDYFASASARVVHGELPAFMRVDPCWRKKYQHSCPPEAEMISEGSVEEDYFFWGCKDESGQPVGTGVSLSPDGFLRGMSRVADTGWYEAVSWSPRSGLLKRYFKSNNDLYVEVRKYDQNDGSYIGGCRFQAHWDYEPGKEKPEKMPQVDMLGYTNDTPEKNKGSVELDRFCLGEAMDLEYKPWKADFPIYRSE